MPLPDQLSQLTWSLRLINYNEIADDIIVVLMNQKKKEKRENIIS